MKDSSLKLVLPESDVLGSDSHTNPAIYSLTPSDPLTHFVTHKVAPGDLSEKQNSLTVLPLTSTCEVPHLASDWD